MDDELLLWLAESQRSHLAAPGLRRELRQQLASEVPWTHGLPQGEFPLRYEPRSLARSPNATRIAVGTKAGFIHLASLEENEWQCQELCDLAVLEPGKTPRSIRAIRFLDDNIVVAGWGEGVFGLFDVGGWKCLQVVRAECCSGSAPPANPEQAWLDRFSRFINLALPGPPMPSERPVLVGITTGSRLHFLQCTADGYRAWTGSPQDVFKGWTEGARVVDGVWSHKFLWVLDSEGHIYRYRREDIHLVPGQEAQPSGPLASTAPSDTPIVHKLEHPREIGEFRAMAVCVMGLAVLTSDDITFLRFKKDGAAPNNPQIEPLRAPWVAVPNAIDCAVCLPFCDAPYYKSGYLTAQSIQLNNPVWTIVGTSQPGLRWISWGDPESGQRPGDPANARLPAVSLAQPQRAGAGDSSVLQVRFAFRSRTGPILVACATRDQWLRITTLVDTFEAKKLLNKELPEAMKRNRGLANYLGVAWWLILRRLEDDFGALDTGEKEKRDLNRLVRLTEKEDLYRLVRRLINTYSRSTLAEETKRQLFRSWMHLALSRAYQLEEELPQALAKLAHDLIVERIGRRDGRQVVQALESFAVFLRKWVVYGHTYGDKGTSFLQLYEWNRRSEHAIDALVYLAKLLRRRVDPLWERRRPALLPGIVVRQLVALEDGTLSLHSSTDGSITAIDASGRILAWEADEDELGLTERHFLEVRLGQLQHRHAEEFFQLYQYGPYARALWLAPAAAGTYLVVFALRGWRTEDQQGEQHQPRLYALRAQQRGDRMRVLAIDSQPLPAELFGLCELKSLSEPGRRHVLAAGTRGSWRVDGAWRACPFVEIAVAVESTGVRLELGSPTPMALDRRGQRSVFSRDEVRPETAHNPCWSLASLRIDDELWLWAGFHDGHIRCFLRQHGQTAAADGSWSEGGSDADAANERALPGLATSAPVWCLNIFEERRLLAYGTSDGVVGVVSIDNRGPAEPVPHLVHHRESSPICGLLSFTDPEAGARLIAATQEGIVVILDLAQTAERTTSTRPHFPGLMVDHFSFGHEARALALVAFDGEPHGTLLGRPLPALLVGSSEGTVFKHVLALPGGTARRRKAFHERCQALVAMAPMKLTVEEDVFRWLRVLDVRGVHLLRFAMTWELRSKWPRQRIRELADSARRQEYLAVLNSFAEEVHGRRPLSPEPAKVIWEEAARVANQIAAEALQEAPGTLRESLLTAFLALNRMVDDLCNRWIGSEQAVESRVLMHSFTCLFDYVGVILIVLADPSEIVNRVRQFLLFTIIQRRLGFNDRLVNLVTLEHLNVAMVRAVWNARGGSTEGRPSWQFSLRPEAGSAPKLGFHDLLTMVGDLGEQHAAALTPSDPLWSQLARFFGAGLLLFPAASHVISQVISESRLTEHDRRFTLAVAAQAKLILRLLGIEQAPELEEALEILRCSFDEDIDADVDPSLGDGGGRPEGRNSAWRRLLAAADQAGWDPTLNPDGVTREFLRDKAPAIGIASYLIRLDHSRDLPDRELTWLRESSVYFEHSRRELKKMLKVRKDLQARLGGSPGEGSPGAMIPADTSIKATLDLCDEEAQYLRERADLFEPQRTQYVKIVRAWQDQVLERATDAVGLLDVLDKFNRHTYRASSDRLASSITELAMQAAPVRPGPGGDRLLRAQIEERLSANPLVKTIFKYGNQLVASTHLAGTLFAVAHDYYVTPSAPAARQTTFRDLEERLGELCRGEEVQPNVFAQMDDTLVPSTIAVWDTILQELVKNTKKYGARSEGGILWVRPHPAGERSGLVFAGDRPFADSLSDEIKQELANLPPAERLKRLRECVGELEKPGVRLAASAAEEGSSGMGLPLILRICRYLGMHAAVDLADLRHAQVPSPAQASVDQQLDWPLSVHIDWETEP